MKPHIQYITAGLLFLVAVTAAAKSDHLCVQNTTNYEVTLLLGDVKKNNQQINVPANSGDKWSQHCRSLFDIGYGSGGPQQFHIVKGTSSDDLARFCFHNPVVGKPSFCGSIAQKGFQVRTITPGGWAYVVKICPTNSNC